MRNFLIITLALLSLGNLSCKDMLDNTIFNKDMEEAVWDETRFNKSKFGK